MEQSTSAAKSGCGGDGDTDAVAKAAEERRRRKKIQNRLNQRARRFRIGKENTANTKAQMHPFRVDRWRLEEYEASRPTDSMSDSNSKLCDHRLFPIQSHKTLEQCMSDIGRAGLSDLDFNIALMASDQSLGTRFPLPADHLLHLIYYNAFRGLYLNKDLLGHLAMYFNPGCEQAEALDSYSAFPGCSVIFSAAPSLPGCLAPTQLQMSRAHFGWINLLPFPKMRDNLIKWENRFDHSEFVTDVVGDFIDVKIFIKQSSFQGPVVASKLILSQGDDDEVTATRKGLIIWGEPYQAESWEATPAFIRKWAWAMEGCEELIESSNRWRMIRGEEPMQLLI